MIVGYARLPFGHVRFTPKSGHWNSSPRCPLCAKSGHYAAQQKAAYSITSSARLRRTKIAAWSRHKNCGL